MKREFRMFAAMLAVLLAIMACNLPGNNGSGDGGNAVLTAAAETVAAQLGDQGFPSPTTPSEPIEEQPTATIAPVATNTTVSTPTSTEKPCNQVAFVKDVTIPDGKVIEPGDTFTKTWRLKNTGSCTWNSGYDLVFDSGDAMNAPATTQLTGGSVAPGANVDVSVDLKAPNSAGTYKAVFQLRDDDSVIFTIAGIWVEIEVEEFKVTKVTISVDDTSFSGACPHKFTFTSKITVNQAGTVTYKWPRSDGGIPAEQSITFASAGTKEVTSTWTFGGAGQTYDDFWKQLQVLSPNAKKSSKALFDLECDP